MSGFQRCSKIDPRLHLDFRAARAYNGTNHMRTGYEPTTEMCERAARQAIKINREALDKIEADDAYCYRKMKGFAEYLQPVFVKILKKVGSKMKLVENQVRLDTPKAVTIQQQAVLAIAEWRGITPSKTLEIQGAGENGVPLRMMVEFVKPGQTIDGVKKR